MLFSAFEARKSEVEESRMVFHGVKITENNFFEILYFRHNGKIRKNENFFQFPLAKYEKMCYNWFVQSYGPLVKRLRHRPLTAKTGVRFPYGSPKKKTSEQSSDVFFLSKPTKEAWHGIRRRATVWNYVEDVHGITRQRVFSSA